MKDIVKDELFNVIAWKKKENEYCDSENYWTLKRGFKSNSLFKIHN